jgi:hypothetical protein
MTSTLSPTRWPSTALPMGETGVTTDKKPSPPGPDRAIPAPTGARKNVHGKFGPPADRSAVARGPRSSALKSDLPNLSAAFCHATAQSDSSQMAMLNCPQDKRSAALPSGHFSPGSCPRDSSLPATSSARTARSATFASWGIKST